MKLLRRRIEPVLSGIVGRCLAPLLSPHAKAEVVTGWWSWFPGLVSTAWSQKSPTATRGSQRVGAPSFL